MKFLLSKSFFTIGLIIVTGFSAIAAPPSFSLAWSEYPSWSVFGVAHEVGYIDGAKGKLGPVEEKWNVDIVLQEADYDTCLSMYAAGQSDAVCITNMDVLNPALGRPTTAILPTSTSFGADALIVTRDINSVEDLKGKKVYGLAKTVSEYMFVRNLELMKQNEKEYEFTNMDPGAAAVAMQQKQSGFDAIAVWNPFVLSTLENRNDVRVLFDSTTIPAEIIDMVAMAQASLSKPGGEAFACAVIEAFYKVNERMAQPDTRDDTLIALGEKFSDLGLNKMRTIVKQTRFYDSPEKAIKLFTGGQVFPNQEVKTETNLEGIMKQVVKFCLEHEIVDDEPSVSYGGAEKSALRFDSSFIEKATK